MTKRIATLLAVLVFANISFAQRVSKEIVDKKKSEIKAKMDNSTLKETDVIDMLAKQLAAGKTSEASVKDGLDKLFGPDIVKKIGFATTIESLKSSKSMRSQIVAKHVEQLLGRLGGQGLNANHVDVITRTLKIAELGLTELSTGVASKFENQVAFTNNLTNKGLKETKDLGSDDIGMIVTANSFKAEINEALEKAGKPLLEQGVTYSLEAAMSSKYHKVLTAEQIAEAKKKYETWKIECKG